MLIIELDGGHDTLERYAVRRRNLESAGYLVARFWTSEVIENRYGVLQAIIDTLHDRAPK